MEVSAKLRFLRMSPRKVRLVVDLVRGLDATKAEHQLQFMNKRAARPVLKLLQSAIANAENNDKLKKENLLITKITVDQGPTLKRWRPRAFGRAGMILKRSSHITITLGEKEVIEKPAAKGRKAADKKETKIAPKEKQPVVPIEDIKHEAKGKEESKPHSGEPKQETRKGFQGLKDKFTRRLGER